MKANFRNIELSKRIGVSLVLVTMLWACWGNQTPPQDRDLSYHRARYALSNGRWDWARIYYEEDLRQNPERLEDLRDLGLAWISGEGGGLTQGVHYLERYLDYKPGDQIIRRRLVSTLLQFENRQEALRWAEPLDDDEESLILKARLWEDIDAAKALDYALRLPATLPAGQALLAKLYHDQNDLEQAAEYAQRAVALDPMNSKAAFRLVQLRKLLGLEFDTDGEALKILNRIDQSREASQLGSFEELASMERLQEIRGTEMGSGYHYRKAKLLLEVGRIQEAEESLQKLEESAELGPVQRLEFARLLFQKKRWNGARNLYEAILKDDPQNPTAITSLSLLECQTGGSAVAVERLRKALVLDPNMAGFHAFLGHALLLEGNPGEARLHYEEALKLAPWMAEWRTKLETLYRVEGDLEAVETLRAAAPTIPSSTPIVALETIASEEVPSDEENSWFREIAGEKGLLMVPYDGRSGERFYVETTGSGVGVWDYDGDGDQDLYLLTGGATPGSDPARLSRNTLYANEGKAFVDQTENAGLGLEGFGMGACVGEINGDSRLDIFLANFGPDRLYLNQGEGKFEDIGSAAGVSGSSWSSSCAFGDLDGDGDLDLYVTHYLDHKFENNPSCGDRARGITAYCRPSFFEGVSDSMFINQGNGRFVEEGEARGLEQGNLEKGLGVVLTDIDEDGDLDIFVANDGTPNRMYVNDGRGYFREMGMESALAFDAGGNTTAGMGIAVGDVDGDLKADILLTNYAFESNSLYRNLGSLLFQDISREAGLKASSTIPVGWGAALFDFDNDGDLDLAVANGHVVDNISVFESNQSYAQRNTIMSNDGRGRFTDVTDRAGRDWQRLKVSRSLAVVDWNNDGRLDLLISNVNQKFDLLENQFQSDHNWLGLSLRGSRNNPSAIGARVFLQSSLGRQVREVRSGGGFQAQSDLRLHFGLGEAGGPVDLTIYWPNGKIQTERIVEANRYVVVEYRM